MLSSKQMLFIMTVKWFVFIEVCWMLLDCTAERVDLQAGGECKRRASGNH